MRGSKSFLLGAALLLSAALAQAAEVGKPAPDFKLPGLLDKPVSLSQYKGKVVVLEWLNGGCPFVRHYYVNDHMQSLQKTYTDKKVIWLSIVSSAPGREGYFSSAAEAAKFKDEQEGSMTDILRDPDGKAGRLYGAKTTPHMFVIDAKGVLVYAGAIDDTPSTSAADAMAAKNWVVQALDEVLKGKKVSVPETRPYGCGVKYKD